MDSFSASAHAHITQHMQISKKHIELVKWIGQKFNNSILISDIREYIEAEIGLDERTVKKYLSFLFSQKFIEIDKEVVNQRKDNPICKVNCLRIYKFLRKYVDEEELKTYAIFEAISRE